MNEAIATSYNGVINMNKVDSERTYGVILQFDDDTKMHFKTTVKRLPSQQEDEYDFEINRAQVFINNQVPNLLIDKLADDLGKIIYPLIIASDKSGYLQRIVNQREIEKRWKENKEALTRYYKGDIAEQAIQSMESAIYGNTLLTGLKNDWFMALFFSGIYGLQSGDFRNTTLLALPVIPYSNALQYAITREITEQHTENKCFIIACKGSLEDKRSAEQILKQNRMPLNPQSGKNGMAKGDTQLNYLLYHSDYSIRSITGNCNVTINGEVTQAVTFEIYHLPENDKGSGQ